MRHSRASVPSSSTGLVGLQVFCNILVVSRLPALIPHVVIIIHDCMPKSADVFRNVAISRVTQVKRQRRDSATKTEEKLEGNVWIEADSMLRFWAGPVVFYWMVSRKWRRFDARIVKRPSFMSFAIQLERAEHQPNGSGLGLRVRMLIIIFHSLYRSCTLYGNHVQNQTYKYKVSQ